MKYKALLQHNRHRAAVLRIAVVVPIRSRERAFLAVADRGQPRRIDAARDEIVLRRIGRGGRPARRSYSRVPRSSAVPFDRDADGRASLLQPRRLRVEDRARRRRRCRTCRAPKWIVSLVTERWKSCGLPGNDDRRRPLVSPAPDRSAPALSPAAGGSTLGRFFAQPAVATQRGEQDQLGAWSYRGHCRLTPSWRKSIVSARIGPQLGSDAPTGVGQPPFHPARSHRPNRARAVPRRACVSGRNG